MFKPGLFPHLIYSLKGSKDLNEVVNLATRSIPISRKIREATISIPYLKKKTKSNPRTTTCITGIARKLGRIPGFVKQAGKYGLRVYVAHPWFVWYSLVSGAASAPLQLVTRRLLCGVLRFDLKLGLVRFSTFCA